MSRIGNKVISLPADVKVELNENVLTVSGKLGSLTLNIPAVIKVNVDGATLSLSRVNEEKHTKQLHGTTRANIANMVVGVNEGYTKKLNITGIGYRATLVGDTLELKVGYSHLITHQAVPGVKISVPTPTEIVVTGIDKQVVGEMAAKIRASRKPEPYKGKGIAYAGEVIRRKEGKKAGKK